MVTSLPLPETHQQAGRVLERLLNNRLIPATHGSQAEMLTAQVEPEIGLANVLGNAESKSEALILKISSPQVLKHPVAARDVILKALGEVPALSKEVQFESDAEARKKVKDTLKELIAASGGSVPSEWLDWKALDGEMKQYDISKHALSGINKSDKAIEFFVEVPKAEHEVQTNGKKVIETLTTKLPLIRKTLFEQAARHLAPKTPEEKKALEDKINALEITIREGDYQGNVSVGVSIRSPEQMKVKRTDEPAGVELEKLRASNVLNQLSTGENGQLERSLGHAVLDNVGELFPIIAGREDMKRALRKKLSSVSNQNPVLKEKVEMLLNDVVFNADAGMFAMMEDPKKEQSKEKPVVNMDADHRGTMVFSMSMPSGHADRALEEIAKMVSLEPAQREPVNNNMAKQPSPEVENLAQKIADAVMPAQKTWTGKVADAPCHFTGPAL